MTIAPTTPAAPVRPPADELARRVLRVREPAVGEVRPDPHGVFSRSVLVSAARCLLTYLVLPFVAPALGIAAGVGPWIGLPLGAVAIGFNIASMRRFWAADHRWRWAYTAVGGAVIVLLLVLMAGDVATLLR